MNSAVQNCPVAGIGLDSPFVGGTRDSGSKATCSASQRMRGDFFGKKRELAPQLALAGAWPRVDRVTYRNLPNLLGLGALDLLLSASILHPSSLFQIPALCGAVLLDWAGYRG